MKFKVAFLCLKFKYTVNNTENEPKYINPSGNFKIIGAQPSKASV